MSISSGPAVIAVAAPPGGGKTTLARGLSARLGGAPTLHYDDYEQITRRSPAEIEAWLDRGAPADEVSLPGFAQALLDLKRSGARHAIVDFLLARAHAETAPHVDLLIWIETPLDIALARTLAEQAALARAAPPQAAAHFVEWLAGYLDSYTRVMHRGYLVQRDTVRARADVVLDGMLPADRLADIAVAEVLRRFP